MIDVAHQSSENGIPPLTVIAMLRHMHAWQVP